MLKYVWTAFLAFALVVAANSVKGQALTLDYFNASPDGSDVLVSWEVPDISGITNFKIYRKIDSETTYTFLDEVAPNGQTQYQYLDYTLFKDNTLSVTYKLLVYKGPMVFTYYASVLHNPTSVQRTWGSIKNMFRN